MCVKKSERERGQEREREREREHARGGGRDKKVLAHRVGLNGSCAGQAVTWKSNPWTARCNSLTSKVLTSHDLGSHMDIGSNPGNLASCSAPIQLPVSWESS